MCHFITLVIPSADTVSITRILRMHGRHSAPNRNLRLKPFAPGGSQFLTRTTGCDCGTVLVHYEIAANDPLWQEKETAKLHRKGWSPAKIKRYLLERSGAKAKADGKAESERIDSLELWRDLIHDLLDQLELNQVGIHVHNYSGGIEDENLSPVVRYASPAENVLDSLNSLKDDELLIFRRIQK
jgi:hypothetical protein